MAVESWLNERATTETRGRILGVYMVVSWIAALGGKPFSPGRIQAASFPSHQLLSASASPASRWPRSEEHTSELQSLMRISYAVFCLKKKKYKQEQTTRTHHTYTKK